MRVMIIEDPYRHCRSFMDFCQAIKVHAADDDTCRMLYRAVEDLRPPETATAL